MLILDSPSSDPRFNIAAEEYLLKETDREYAFFFINNPSIIIGKHQNAWAEINLPWTRQNNIPVFRRISGGGTVWHDPGNLNFSFILNGEEGKLVNFREYAAPILDYLVGLGIPAEFGERNEILAGDVKISGNAEHIHRNRVLHHGTLLFSSDLDKLRTALDTKPELYVDKAVQSIRSKVGNIRDFLNKEIEIADFRRQLIAHVMLYFPGSEIFTLSDEETGRIQKLVEEKYSLWKWNIGYFPKYQLEREWSLGRIRLKAELNVEKGKISGCRLAVTRQFLSPDDGSSTEILEMTGLDNEYSKDAKEYGILEDILSEQTRDLDTLAERLIGQSHDPESLHAYLSERDLVNPEWIDIFVKGLF